MAANAPVETGVVSSCCSAGSASGGRRPRRRRSRPRPRPARPPPAPRAPSAARGRACRGRARRPSACAGRPLARLREERRAVVVQVRQVLRGPGVGAAPARCRRPRHGAPAQMHGADVRPLAAHEADRAGGAGAHRDALEGDALEIDLDGREAVLAVEEAGRGQAARGRSGSTKPSSRARRTPISHSASSSSSCALASRAGRRHGRCAARRGHDLERPLMLLARALVVALGDDLGEAVSVSVTRRPRAIRISRPSEMSLTLWAARRRPPRRRASMNRSTTAPTAASAQTQVPVPLPGAAAAEEGRAAAASAAAPRAPAREARFRSGGLGRPLGGHVPSVGVRGGGPVLRVRDLTADRETGPILANETLMF